VFTALGYGFVFILLPSAIAQLFAIVFSSTLLQDGIQRNWFAKRLMKGYNQKGIFSNQQDSLESLVRSLNQ
jgi:hypothetical protein